MSCRRFGAAAVLCVLLAGCAAGEPAPPKTESVTGTTTGANAQQWPALPTSEPPASRVTTMQAEIDRWVATGLLAGVTVAVATPQGVWSGAAGVDGAGTPLVPEAGMALASITKNFTAAEVMLLAQRGALDLDEPATTYIDVPQVANGVTVRQLLAQRSGVVESRDGPLGDPDAHWSTARYLSYVPEKSTKPGETFSYDNTNYVLLGLIIEKVTGHPVGDAVKADLWDPLDLDRLAYQDEQQLTPPLAAPGPDDQFTGDITRCDSAGPWLPCRAVATLLGPAGGAAGDAEAVARWGYALYGSRVLDKKSVDAMTDFPDDVGYGLGTWDFSTGGYARWNIDAVGHDGLTIGYRTVMAVFEDAHVSVAILTPTATETVPYVQYLVKAGSLLTP